MGLLSSALKAELEKGLGTPGQPEVYPVLDLALPSATRRWSGVGAAASNQYEPRVTSWGAVNRLVTLSKGELQATSMTVEIADTDRDFATELAGYRTQVRRSTATVKLISPNITSDDEFTVFSGILDSWKQVAPMVWELHLRCDDRPVESGFVPRAGLVQPDWPNITAEALAQYAPLLYGRHSSEALEASGMLPTLYVDAVSYRYIVALGVCTVDAVYADGESVNSSEYTSELVVVNGRGYSVLTFTSDRGDEVITVDAKGLTDAGAGGGTLLSNPSDQLKNALSYFVYNDWGSGAYSSTSGAPLDAASFATASDFFSDLGYETSRRIGGTETQRVMDVVNEWSASNQALAFWKNDGNLAVGVLDHRSTGIYPTTVLRGNEVATKDLPADWDTSTIVSRITGQFAYGETDGKYFGEFAVEDLSVPENVTESLQLPWSLAAVAATS